MLIDPQSSPTYLRKVCLHSLARWDLNPRPSAFRATP